MSTNNVNKVSYYGETLIDLTDDGVTPEALAEGVTAHDASGALIVGTAKPITLVQELGDSEDAVISQAGVTNEIKKISTYITPQMFGAVGDGVADDTAAIQAAMDYMQSTGTPVKFGVGKYLVSKTINIADKTEPLCITGAGKASLIITTETFDGDYVFNIDVKKTNYRSLHISDFALHIYADVSGFYLEEIGMKSIIDNLWIKNYNVESTRHGIYCASSTVVTYSRIKIEHFENGSGIAIKGMHSSKIFDCDITYCKYAIYLSGGSNNSVEMCRIDENTHGIYQNSTTNLDTDNKVFDFKGTFINFTIEQCRFENNVRSITLLAYGNGYLANSGVTISNNYFTGLSSEHQAMRFGRCNLITISENLFKGEPYSSSNRSQNIGISSTVTNITLNNNTCVQWSKDGEVVKSSNAISSDLCTQLSLYNDIEVNQTTCREYSNQLFRYVHTSVNGTLDVSANNYYAIADGSNITAISVDSVTQSKEITLLCEGNVAFVHGNNLKLNGGVDFAAEEGDIITFVCGNEGWSEKCRSVNRAVSNSTSEVIRINVRDFGAVGDGVTDDRQAIIDAFAEALNNLPCEVYFPAGTYGISNGIHVDMAYGTGGLLVRGAGRDVTTIKYLEDGYNPDVTGTSTQWYALRIWPVGMPNTNPTNEADYLHDISITGLTVYDPDPIAHAWNTCKGDQSGEETHGFDLQYVIRASVTNCNIINVGDEGIDLNGCIDAIVSGNHIVGSPAAGAAGGAISIGDGCKGVVVSGNTVNGSADNEILVEDIALPAGTILSTSAVLPDGNKLTKSSVLSTETTLPAGTVLQKYNFGIAVESLSTPVSDVVVVGNVITNIHGNGVNLGATQTGAGLTNISVADNIIHGCSSGVNFSGTQPKSAIKISGNTISDCYADDTSFGYAIYSDTGFTDITVLGNTIRNIGGNYALRLISSSSKQMIYDNLFENIANQIFYSSGDVIIKDCVFNGVGTAAHLGSLAAIQKYTGTLTVSGCKLSDIRSNCAVSGATVVENTDIEMVDTSGTPNAGGDVLKNLSGDANSLLRVANCKFGARFIINRDNAIVQGVHITSTKIGNNAITVNANGVLVTGCNISINSNSAIAEGEGYNGNIFTNNITNRSITTVGDKTVSVNNVDLRTLTD